MRASRCVLVILMFAGRALHASAPATLNSDDSCEISVAPAATLLLPYFEVNLSDPAGEATLFTIANVSSLPQIARVTLWTDRAYPVLAFNIFLTGYDIQSISLYDVLVHGRIAEPGTSSNTEVGQRSAGNDTNPLVDLTQCGVLPDRLPPQILADLRSALTLGRTTGCANARIGSVQHSRDRIRDHRCGAELWFSNACRPGLFLERDPVRQRPHRRLPAVEWRQQLRPRQHAGPHPRHSGRGSVRIRHDEFPAHVL